MKWQAAFNLEQGRGALALYLEALGQLLQEQARMEELKNSLRRVERLRQRQAVADEEFEQVRLQWQGQRQKVGRLEEAVDELKRRADQSGTLIRGASLGESGLDQLKPFLARIESLVAERGRLQERLEQGVIRAPANGLVVKHQRLPGERCKASEPLLSFLEQGSLEVVLYLPQAASDRAAVGAEFDVVLDPYPEPLHCTVVRLCDQFEPAPEQLKRNYAEGQRLLPVVLRLEDGWERWAALRTGGVVKLPYRPWFLGGGR